MIVTKPIFKKIMLCRQFLHITPTRNFINIRQMV